MLSDLLTFVLALAVCGMARCAYTATASGCGTAASRGETAGRGGDCLCETGEAAKRKAFSSAGFAQRNAAERERGASGPAARGTAKPRGRRRPGQPAAALHSRPQPGTPAAPARAQGWRADKYDAILANIDAYDGTEKGQKVIE